MRLRNCQKVFSFFLGFVITIALASRICAAERQWTRSEILAIADAEAKRLGYDVEPMTVSFELGAPSIR